MKGCYGIKGRLTREQTTAAVRSWIAQQYGVDMGRVEMDSLIGADYFIHGDPPRTIETDDDAWEGE